MTGFDGLTDYYDVELKKTRHKNLSKFPNFNAHIGQLEDKERLMEIARDSNARIIVHLAAQAGVRYSLENPDAYIDSNLKGTFNILECAKLLKVEHLMFASTSSVYGGNQSLPFRETDKTESQLTLYAATKKSNENMAHAYAHLWNIPTTALRFFTVYGPWGRPDLALFKFVKAALKNESIDVYNYGQMARDFTYVDDLVTAIQLLIDKPPCHSNSVSLSKIDTLSHVAPFRSINIGNGNMVPLMRFIRAIESALGRRIEKRMLPMQQGDVPSTWANTELLKSITGFSPETDVEEGIRKFVSWYLEHYVEENSSGLALTA